MKRYVIDAWAWMEYFDASPKGVNAKKIIENCEIFTNAVTIAELTSRFLRASRDADEMFNALITLSKIVDVNASTAKGIGKLHHEVKRSSPNFSYGDASVLYTARALSAKVLTGDPDFKGLKGVEMLK